MGVEVKGTLKEWQIYSTIDSFYFPKTYVYPYTHSQTSGKKIPLSHNEAVFMHNWE